MAETISTTNTTPALVSVTAFPVTIIEGTSKTKSTVDFSIKLAQALSKDIKIQYATENDTALVNKDYVKKSGTITFKAGETNKIVSVKVLGDSDPEGDESFGLKLTTTDTDVIQLSRSNPSAKTVTATLLDDDSHKAVFNINNINADKTSIANGTTISGTIAPMAETNFLATTRNNKFISTDKADTFTFIRAETPNKDIIYNFDVKQDVIRFSDPDTEVPQPTEHHGSEHTLNYLEGVLFDNPLGSTLTFHGTTLLIIGIHPKEFSDSNFQFDMGGTTTTS